VNEPLYSIIYAFYNLEYKDKDYAIKLALVGFILSEFNLFVRLVRRRLNGRCKGILEVRADRVVEFLYWIVRDFLLLAEMIEFLYSKERLGFQPRILILRAFMA
jgi:hypothetical protein